MLALLARAIGEAVNVPAPLPEELAEDANELALFLIGPGYDPQTGDATAALRVATGAAHHMRALVEVSLAAAQQGMIMPTSPQAGALAFSAVAFTGIASGMRRNAMTGQAFIGHAKYDAILPVLGAVALTADHFTANSGLYGDLLGPAGNGFVAGSQNGGFEQVIADAFDVGTMPDSPLTGSGFGLSMSATKVAAGYEVKALLDKAAAGTILNLAIIGSDGFVDAVVKTVAGDGISFTFGVVAQPPSGEVRVLSLFHPLGTAHASAVLQGPQ